MTIAAPAWTHADLVADLARFIRADDFVCSEVRFGSAWLDRARIPDVLKIRKSYTRWDVQIYEVKAHRADFLGEIRNGKWAEYLPMSSRLYFATPLVGVVKDKMEIPEGMGWIARGPKGWHVRQAPKIREFTPDPNQLLAVLMSVELARCKLEYRVDELKKTRHSHNVSANGRMKQRLDKMERLMNDRRRERGALRDCRAEIAKLTGKDPGMWPNNWAYAIREHVLAMNGGSLANRAGYLAEELREFQAKLAAFARDFAEKGD